MTKEIRQDNDSITPDWSHVWTREEAEKELSFVPYPWETKKPEPFVFNGPGWYCRGTDTLLVIPVEPGERDMFSHTWPPGTRFNFHVYNGRNPGHLFGQVVQAPTRLDVRNEPVAKVRVTATVEVVVDEDWISYITENVDIFQTDHCGYWLRGIQHSKLSGVGWLCYESGGDVPQGKEPNAKEALEAWRTGRALPPGYFRLDRETCIRAWAEGVKREGVNWYENGDANSYDTAIQMTLLGEIRYG